MSINMPFPYAFWLFHQCLGTAIFTQIHRVLLMVELSLTPSLAGAKAKKMVLPSPKHIMKRLDFHYLIG